MNARKCRSIAAVEELDALGLRATILDAGQEVWTNDGESQYQWGSIANPESHCAPKWRGSEDIDLPAIVLYEPEENQ